MRNQSGAARLTAPLGWGVAILLSFGGLAVAACSGHPSASTPTPTPTPGAPAAEQNTSGVTKETKNPLKDLTAAAAAGKTLFAANCASCHGDKGKGDGPIAESLPFKPSNLTEGDVPSDPDGELFLVVRNGKKEGEKMAMPPVKKLTDEQIWQVVAYVRTLAKK